jgi:hypothetical protein
LSHGICGCSGKIGEAHWVRADSVGRSP